MHTESVAWLSERKDVLLGAFFFSALLSYIRFLDKRDWKFFILSLLLFLLSLGVKGQAVTLAVTLIAVDYLKGKHLFSKSVILEKIPFFLIALIFGLVALGGHGEINENGQVGINLTTIERLSSASYAYLLSFIKLLIPFNLSAFYPYPDDILNETISWYTTFLLIIPLILFLFWYFYKKQKRVYLFGLAFFTFNIVLVLKIFPSQIGIFMMADRYTYIPSIGVFIILYYLIDKINLNHKLLLLFAFIYISGLSIYAFERNKTWKNSIALWSDVQKKYPDNAWVLNMKGKAYASENRYDAAIKTFRQAINIEPKMYIANYNLGNAYHKKGKLEKAYRSYENVLKIQQDFAPAWLNAGTIMLKTKQFGQALYAFNQAIKYDPNYSEAYYNKGYLKLIEGDKQTAQKLFSKSIEHNPYFLPAYRNRGVLLMEMNKYRRAIKDFNHAIRFSNKSPKLLELRGDCKMMLKDMKGACNDWEKAKKLGNTRVNNKIKSYCF